MKKQKLIRRVFSLYTLCDVIYITKNSQTLPLTLLSVRCHPYVFMHLFVQYSIWKSLKNIFKNKK